MPNKLRWRWYNKNRNKVHNKCNAVESSWNHPHHLGLLKNCLPRNQFLVPKKVEDCCATMHCLTHSSLSKHFSYSFINLPRLDLLLWYQSSMICGRPGFDPWVGKIPWRRKYPLQYSCLENPMDRGAWWAMRSPWGHKELDMTVWPTHIKAPNIGTYLTCSIASAKTLDVVTFFLNRIKFYFL